MFLKKVFPGLYLGLNSVLRVCFENGCTIQDLEKNIFYEFQIPFPHPIKIEQLQKDFLIMMVDSKSIKQDVPIKFSFQRTILTFDLKRERFNYLFQKQDLNIIDFVLLNKILLILTS